MNQDNLRKIKKCMELSKSGNPNEAAVAIKQMKSLMEKYGVSEKQVLAADIHEMATELDTVKAVPQWVINLHCTIGQAMDCESMIERSNFSNLSLIYLGERHMVELSAHAFVVLMRQLKKDRTLYISQNLKRYKRSNKTRLADKFCEGWVVNVGHKVRNLNPNQEIKEKIKAYKEQKFKNYSPKSLFKGVSRNYTGRSSAADQAKYDGYEASSGVNLFTPTAHNKLKELGAPC